MNDATLTAFREALAVQTTRALLVTTNNDGSLAHSPVRFGESVLNIEQDLRAHLTDKPRTDEWLIGLRDFLRDWIRAREDAAAFGGLVIQVTEDDDMGVRSCKT